MARASVRKPSPASAAVNMVMAAVSSWFGGKRREEGGIKVAKENRREGVSFQGGCRTFVC